jgi:nitrile hydratase
MDGIHDLGGMQGFGPVEPDDDTVGYHESWEGLAHSSFVGTMGSGAHTMEEFRHAIERMEPAHYLDAAYWDRWLVAVSTLAVEKEIFSPDALRERTEAFATGEATLPERRDPDRIEELLDGVAEAYSAWRDEREPAFSPGDEVRVRNIHPDGHTRCPGYVRNARGTITEHRGTHTLPEALAHGGAKAEPVYNVAFDRRELWSDDPDPDPDAADDEPADVIRVELWESYLEAITA